MKNPNNRFSDDEDNQRPGAVEMPSDGEGYDSNYEIYTSQENIKQEPKNNSTNQVRVGQNQNLYQSQSQSNYNQNRNENNYGGNNRGGNPLNKSDNQVNVRSNNREETPINNSQDSKLIDDMRKKIKEQATRLTQLEGYKILTEKRIKQLMPTHNFPVTDADLQNLPKNTGSGNQKYSNQNISKVIDQKEQEIQELKRKLSQQESKISQLSDDNSRLMKSQSSVTLNNKILFPNEIPPVDKVPNDKLRETYVKIYSSYIEVYQEKEQILETLRNETITNEEQRNYIEILRQTIESSIVKNGLTPYLQVLKQSNSQFYSSNNKMKQTEPSNVDLIIDISKIKAESDKFRKELIMAQVLITELRQEVEFLKKANEDMNIKKDRIKETLDTGIKELDQAKDKVRSLESEKDFISGTLSEMKLSNQKMREENEEHRLGIRKYERELNEAEQKIKDYQIQLENYNKLQIKLQEYKENFEKMYDDFEKLLQEKKLMEDECSDIKNELEEKIAEIDALKLVIEDKEEKFERERKNLNNEIQISLNERRKIERLNSDLTVQVKEKENLCKKLDERILTVEKQLTQAKAENEKLNIQFDDIKQVSDKKVDLTERTIREVSNNNTNLKNSVENLTIEKDNLYNDYINMKNECEKLDINIVNINKELENKNHKLNKLSEDFENLYRTNKSLEEDYQLSIRDRDNISKDLRYWKEKYDKDINMKIGEINQLNIEIDKLRKEVTQLKGKNSNLKNSLQISSRENEEVRESSKQRENLFRNDKDDLMRRMESAENENRYLENLMEEKEGIIYKLEDQLNRLNQEIKNKDQSLEEIKRKLDKTSNELSKEGKNNYELQLRTSTQSNKIDELSRLNQFITEEKEKLDLKYRRVTEDLDTAKKIDKEHQMKHYNLNNSLHEIKLGLQGVLNNLCRSYASKFNVMINNRDNIFSRDFIQLIDEYLTSNSVREENNHNELIKKIEYYLGTVSEELENFFDLVRANSETIQNYQFRTKSLEQDLFKSEKGEEEVERKLQVTVNELESEIIRLNKEREDLLSQLNNSIQKNKQESKKQHDEIQFLRLELSKQQVTNDSIGKDNRDKIVLLNNASFQVEALEERIIILVKEKKYLENLILRVSKCISNRELHRIINEVMNVNDAIAQMERDRSKIESNLGNIQEDELPRNDELYLNIKKEKEGLKSLSYDLERKIQEKIQQQKSLESELKGIEINEKKKAELLYDYEFKIKQLEKELADCKDELRPLKNKSMMREREEEISYAERISNINRSVAKPSHSGQRNFESLEFTPGDRHDRLDSFPSQDYNAGNITTNYYDFHRNQMKTGESLCNFLLINFQ
jgi:hypothetical protein